MPPNCPGAFVRYMFQMKAITRKYVSRERREHEDLTLAGYQVIHHEKLAAQIRSQGLDPRIVSYGDDKSQPGNAPFTRFLFNTHQTMDKYLTILYLLVFICLKTLLAAVFKKEILQFDEV